MRTFLAAALVALSMPAAAVDTTWMLPPDGLYCPIGVNVMPISISEGGVGIDGLDCAAVSLEGGRMWSNACYANGGTTVPYDVDFEVSPSGAILHDGVRFQRRVGPAPCPAD
ncbi:hypothetical protein AO398_00535 [Methylobacterium sp. GXS13]|jgi:hypothetical protein|uniref:hypothetical protein n=1 Tax=Methylobacterium sp. GXS13 TaxID=1730094 RepID=UPI00071C0158|nr:hypothetical protein [Methylobacterium sp. GXS13]KST61212.1 hypothetical protein AO398_00535 [Methylobacterium sp. GXS13]